MSVQADDQLIGVGDGARVSFQLIKGYANGGASWSRRITRVVAGSAMIAVNGTVSAAAAVNLQTGEVTFASPPPAHAVVTAGFRFDTPVRFDVDALDLTVEGVDAIRLGATPLVEIFDGGAA